MRILVLAMIASCDAGSQPSQAPAAEPIRIRPDAQPRVTAAPDAPPAPPAPPVEEDRYPKLTPTTRVMATADGSAVLLQIVDQDGARGEPNLAFEVRDRRDRTLNKAVVEKLDENVSAATIAARIATANNLIASKPFTAVAALPSSEVDDSRDPDRRRFAGNGLVVELLGDELVVRQDQRKVVARRIPKAWRGPKYHLASEDLDCSNPEFLSNVYAAPAAKLIVVNIAYHGNDTCWEPTDQLHVVAW